MYIIEKPIKGKIRRETVAAFELKDGVIVFDATRGDAEFVHDLKTVGVKIFDEKTGVFRNVLPSEGQAFIEACLDAYCGAPLACNNEEDLDKLRRRFPSPGVPRTSDPPPISAAS